MAIRKGKNVTEAWGYKLKGKILPNVCKFEDLANLFAKNYGDGRKVVQVLITEITPKPTREN